MAPPLKRLVAVVAAAACCATAGLLAGVGGSAQAATAPALPFPAHTTYKVGVLPSASQSARDTAVQKAYDAWKSTYLVKGCASNEYYVSTKGDGDAPNNGTVSEAQGYGMNIVPLMAGYDADAKAEFDGLWQLVKDHKDAGGLMQWQLDGKTCKYADSGTPDSATDGDLDIGYGLILADRQWGGYTADAKAWLASFYAHDVAPDGHLKCEDDGPNTDTRPSDMMLDHLRAFAAYDTAHDWNKVVTRTEAVITAFTSGYSSSAGLLSDFVVNADTTSPKPAPANYQENQPDNIVGYNSVRVPWHMGTDALLNGSSTAAVAYGVAKKESDCLKSLSGGNPAKVQPHIKLNCANGNVSGDTEAEEAGDSAGPAAMAAGDQAWTDAIWKQLASNPFQDGYYGETIKMLVYLVMAGDYWNPATATGNPPTTPTPSATTTPTPTPTPTPTKSATPTPSATTTAPAQPSQQAFLTFYGWYDNTPPGADISYPGLHSTAGGTGTYADPITFASSTAEIAKGARIWVPRVGKYFIMEDDCGECNDDWKGKGPNGGPNLYHYDLWLGGKGGNAFDAIDCEDALTHYNADNTPTMEPVVVNPPNNEPYDATPLFNTGTGACYGGAQPNSTVGQYHNVSTGQCITKPAGGTKLATAACDASAAETFTFHGAFLVSGTQCATLSGSNIQLATCDGGPNQQWSINPDLTISDIQTGNKCFRASGSTLSAGSCSGTASQWTFTAADGTGNPPGGGGGDAVLLSQGKSATASSTESSTYAAGKAFDGDLTSTRWGSKEGVDPQWLRVDLGKSADISRVKLTWEAAYAKAYTVQVSGDDSTWTTVYSTTAGKGGTEDLTGLKGTGRYVRINGTARGTSYGYSLYEMQVYGTTS